MCHLRRRLTLLLKHLTPRRTLTTVVLIRIVSLTRTVLIGSSTAGGGTLSTRMLILAVPFRGSGYPLSVAKMKH